MRVLFIADQTSKLRSLAPEIEARGFVVETVSRKGDGHRKVLRGAYDAIVLDQSSPTEKAASQVETWRAKGVTGHVLLLFPRPVSLPEKVRCLDVGADDCLSQPLHVEELLARLRAVERRAHRGQEMVWRIHDLEIDTDNHVVRRDGRLIHLTPREFEVLKLLAAHPGKIVSRSMILEHLYKHNTVCRSNVVDVFIRYLRKKIDQGFSPPLILTRWGQGYLLRGEELS
jgi:DNA-binding response OmpR family regulator